MKHLKFIFTAGILILFLSLISDITNAQKPEKIPSSTDFEIAIRNIKQTDPNTMEFDIFILKTNPEVNFELILFQAGIEFNAGILNGAAQTPGMAQILKGTSGLADSLVPFVANTATPGLIKLAGRPAPRKTGGTLISDKDKGTRICRLRLTNSIPFAKNTSPELRLTSNTTGNNSYATRVGVIAGKEIIQLDVIPDKNAVSKESFLLNPTSEK